MCMERFDHSITEQHGLGNTRKERIKAQYPKKTLLSSAILHILNEEISHSCPKLKIQKLESRERSTGQVNSKQNNAIVSTLTFFFFFFLPVLLSVVFD